MLTCFGRSTGQENREQLGERVLHYTTANSLPHTVDGAVYSFQFATILANLELKRSKLLTYTYIDHLGASAIQRAMNLQSTAGVLIGTKNFRQVLIRSVPSSLLLTDQEVFDSALNGFLKNVKIVYGLHS
jgi:hypothetical protein